MTVTPPRHRLSIAQIMMIIAFLAVAVASASASWRDRARPDFLLAIYAIQAAIMAATEFSRKSGRALAGVWGQNLSILFVFFVGEIWYGLLWSPSPSSRNDPTVENVLHVMVWNYWPILSAIAAAFLGNSIARKRYDRLHPSPPVAPAVSATP